MKIFSLIYNEFAKQFKKPSTKILIALILLSAVALPIVMKNFKATDYDRNKFEHYQFMIQDYDNMLNNIKDDNTQKAKIQKTYYEIEKEYNQLLSDNKVGYGDWREKEAEEFRYNKYKLAAIEFVLEGYEKDTVLSNIQGADVEEVSKYFDLTLAKKKEIEANFTAIVNEVKDVVNNNDFNKHTELEIQRVNARIADHKNNISEYEKLLAKNPTDEEGKAKLKALNEKKEIAEENIPQLEQDLVLLQFRFDNKIDYSKENWKNNSIVAIEKELQDFRMKLLSEKEYNTSSYYTDVIASSYEEYVENYKKANETRVLKMKELWYGLEKNIPDLGAVKDARSVIDSTYEIYVILAVVIAIIIGGTIVAGEYSTGSIRLLLIRPVSRWKILLSKFLTVLIFGYAIVLLGVGILVISSGAVFGFESLQVPVLQTINGSVVEVSYIKYMIPMLLTSTASLIFISSLVFMISTLARNTALAVALGMLVYGGAAIGSQLLISMKQIWLVNTFIPYINSSFFKLLPNVSEMLRNSGLTMDFAGGAVQLLIISLVLIAITFTIFVKRDVKN